MRTSMRGSSVLLSVLALLSSGCSFFALTAGGVGAKVAPSKAMENRGSPQKSKLLHGFLERLPTDLTLNAWVVASSLDDNVVATVSVGRLGYYSLFVPPGSYRLTAYLDRDGDGAIVPSEMAGQVASPFTVPAGRQVAFFGLDLELSLAATSGFDGYHQVLMEEQPLDEGIPEFGAAEDLAAPRFGPANIELGAYESTTAFFSHVAPVQHLDELDLTAGRVPMILVHGINDSPVIFRDFETHIPDSDFEPLYFYYPTGARLPAMAQLLSHLFLSGKVFPTFPNAAMIAHSMGGLVARGSLNYLSGQPGESGIDFYGSFVTPYGGVSAAEFGIKSGPFIVPSWIDVSPKQDFLTHLFRPLPKTTSFGMINGDAKGDSDGVISLASQRRKEAVQQAQVTEIFHQTHVGIVSDPLAIKRMLEWVQSYVPQGAWSQAPAGHGSAPKTARLGNLELRHRAHALRVLLSGKLKERGCRAFTSLITPTVARIRVESSSRSAVFQLSVGERVRLDQASTTRPLLLLDWPSDEAETSELVRAIVDQVAAHTEASPSPTGRPVVPFALRLRAVPGGATPADELGVKWSPPPIVLSTGLGFSLATDRSAPQVNVPGRLDAYFGYVGMGLDARFTTWAGTVKVSGAQLLFQPINIVGGPRIRLGHRFSPISGQLGVSGGLEFGRGTFLTPEAERWDYTKDEELGHEFLINGVVYGSAGMGVRILQDFYAIGLADLGMRFPEKEVELSDTLTVPFHTEMLFRATVGVEVRVP